MTYLLTLIGLLLLGCGSHPLPLAAPAQRATLQAEWQNAVNKVPTPAPSPGDCDDALWAGDARAAGISATAISAFLTLDGRTTRRPGADCGPASEDLSGAPATTSTDMELGIIEGLLAARDLTSLQRMEAYIASQGGWAGVPRDAQYAPYTYVKPGTRTLLTRAIRHLGGNPQGTWEYLPIVNGPAINDPDYVLHLTCVALAAERQTGHWSADDEWTAQDLCTRNPSDAAVQAVCGHTTEAEALILNPDWSAPGYVRGAPSYAWVHKAWILHYLLTGGQLDK